MEDASPEVNKIAHHAYTDHVWQPEDLNDNHASQEGDTVNLVSQSDTQHDVSHGTNNRPTKINSPSRQEFMKQLMEHFAILCLRNKINW